MGTNCSIDKPRIESYNRSMPNQPNDQPNDTVTEGFGQRLRRLRLQRGVSQDRLAREAGTTATHVYQLESARRGKRPTEHTLNAYATALSAIPIPGVGLEEVTPDYLLWGERAPQTVDDWGNITIEAALRQKTRLSDEEILVLVRMIRAMENSAELDTIETLP